MYVITINVENHEELAEACRQVANSIDEGNTCGIIGWSGDTWSVENDSEENN